MTTVTPLFPYPICCLCYRCEGENPPMPLAGWDDPTQVDFFIDADGDKWDVCYECEAKKRPTILTWPM
jgi:hypothetical protein